jgi:protein phosphatase
VFGSSKPKYLQNGLIVESVEIGWMTDVGRRRDHNEDDLFVFSPAAVDYRRRGMLVAVADGMGGHAAGEQASRLAVENIGAYYDQDGDLPETPVEILRGRIDAAHRAIYSMATCTPHLKGMGTTLSAVLIDGSMLHVGHVGDSRVYLIREGVISQVTQDHSLVAEQLRLGIITAEEAASHPGKNIITRALGTKESVAIDYSSLPVKPGDRILACSDGLHGVVSESRLVAVAVGSKSPAEACENLVAEANANGGPDNVTVVIVHIKPQWLICRVVAKIRSALFGWKRGS